MQPREVSENIFFNFLWFGLRVQLLQFGDDLLNSVLAVATLDDLKAWAVQTQRPLRHVQNARWLTLFIQSATYREAWAAVEFRRHAGSLPGQKLLA